MFTPRKNRNVRKKISVNNEEPAEATDSSSPSAVAADTADVVEATLLKPKKVKKKTASAVLSFGDEEQESEGTFKIKKSAASRRVALGKEDSSLDQPTIISRATVGNTISYSKEALEELRKITLSTTPSSRPHGTSESVMEEQSHTLHGASTVIPDAHAIHLARKKREQMRLRNDRDEEEFISLAGGDDDTIAEERNTRLIREEDDDMDDGEADLEKVMGDKLELGAKAQRQAAKSKRDEQRELIEEMDEDEEDLEETREWEMQQIRNAGIVKSGSKSKTRSTPEPKGVVFPVVTQIPNIANVRSRIQGYLENLRNQHSQHIKQQEQIRREEAEIMLRAGESDEAITKARIRYTFFQELRLYCRDLAAFFEAKFPELEAIERDYRSMLSDRTKVVVERRRLDLQDDLAEFANVIDDDSTSKGRKDNMLPEVDEFGRSVGVDPLVTRKRRRADRERRQVQRRQSRVNVQDRSPEGSKENHDGLSTDDELGGGDERELGEAVMELEDRRVNIFKEVGSEFRSMEAVKKHFQAWKTNYPQDYNKAYGGLLLPLVFDFFVRQETCLWNPLRVKQDISEQSWHRTVSSYAIVYSSASHLHSDSESDREDEEDMDKELMSKVVAKSLCPKITQFLTSGGVDLYSVKQTRYLKEVLDQLLDFVDKKDNKMDQLLKATLQAILQTAQAHRDQFLEAQPLTPRHILTAQGHEARDRYLWKTIGLFRNLMFLRRFVPTGSIDLQVVDGLLHDCILRLLEGDDKDIVAKYQMIFQALPHDIRSQERHLVIDRMAQSIEHVQQP